MSDVWREIVEHEGRERKRSLPLFELFQRARDKQRAAEIIEEYAYGRIGYDEAVRRLRVIAEAEAISNA